MPEHYDVTLEVRYFALLSDVATARVTPTDATSFVCDEIRRAFERGKESATATGENANLRRNAGAEHN